MWMEPGRPGGAAILAGRQDSVVRHGFCGQRDEELFRLVLGDVNAEDARGPGTGAVLQVDEFGAIEVKALPVEDLFKTVSDGS
ncbi:hypothetical protein GCM10010977_17160 [Citricoccus zhacaiensis]|uniref:Uncharacterized protein n=1 Tax=Citricoccus zhacaiensis TaxID=489142 RepID=A0ABQ2LZH5_9MICC|nr:hypothetical protein GCM10010977_17160 [Citricoccus zhacaiensis]